MTETKSFLEARGLGAAVVTHQGPKWAAAMVRKGCFVHPLKTGSKLPATQNGVLDAELDASKIYGNYGVSMSASNLVGVDLDDYVEGNEIDQFLADYAIPATFTVITGSGGRSMYFLAPTDSKIANAQNLVKGVDIRGNNGYMVGPGSKIHPDEIKQGGTGDGVYRFDPEGGMDFAPLPEKLAALLVERSKPKEYDPEVLERTASAAAYEAMDPATKQKVDAWLDRTVGGIMSELHAMKGWEEGQRGVDHKGDEYGWEEGVRDRAFRLAQIVNADWNPLGKDDVIGLLRKNLPNDAKFTLADGLGKFARALGKADAAHYPGFEEEYDMLSGVEDRTPGKADGGAADDEGEVIAEAKLVGGVQGHIVFDTKGCRRIQVDDDGKQKEKELLPATTARRLSASWPIGKQPLSKGQNWWVYKDGTWILNDSIVRLSMAASFDDNYKVADVAPVEDVLSTMAPEIEVGPHHDFINFQNGMLEWRTGELHEHGPEFKSTVQLPHSWNPEATCPKFDEWLDQRLSGDGIQLAWELIATTLYSGNPIQRAGLLYGVGKSGKSTFLETVQGLVGDANCAALSPQDMTKTVFATHSLLGKQANIVTDIDPTKIAETAIFKRVVASEAIQAQQKNKPEFSFRPFCNHLFSANQIPRSSDRTSAWTRRFAILRFMTAIGVETKVVDQYHRVLLQEAEGIIAKAVSLLPELLARGDYSVIQEDQDEFEKATDFTSEFWEECAVISGDMKDFTATEHIAKAFEVWCQRNGYSSRPPVDDIVLKLRDNPKLKKDRGRVGGRQVRGWKGIHLVPEYRVEVTADQSWDIPGM